MSFHVGLLYSTHDFLDLVVSGMIKADEFKNLEEKFTLVPASDVYKVAQACNWIRIAQDGVIIPSERGKKIQSIPDASQKLRLQIADLIDTHNPAWARKLMYGRREALPGMPEDAEQCFRESGLLDEWSGEIIREWDNLGKNARQRRSESSQKIGRQAELWAVQFEEVRTEGAPELIALESSFAGFDVLSQLSRANDKVLRIEVKGSTRRPNEASFFITRNEWATANRLGNYKFHLWFVSTDPKLYVVDYKKVEGHISLNQGNGNWSTVEIPYKPFLDCEKRIRAAEYKIEF